MENSQLTTFVFSAYISDSYAQNNPENAEALGELSTFVREVLCQLSRQHPLSTASFVEADPDSPAAPQDHDWQICITTLVDGKETSSFSFRECLEAGAPLLQPDADAGAFSAAQAAAVAAHLCSRVQLRKRWNQQPRDIRDRLAAQFTQPRAHQERLNHLQQVVQYCLQAPPILKALPPRLRGIMRMISSHLDEDKHGGAELDDAELAAMLDDVAEGLTEAAPAVAVKLPAGQAADLAVVIAELRGVEGRSRDVLVLLRGVVEYLAWQGLRLHGSSSGGRGPLGQIFGAAASIVGAPLGQVVQVVRLLGRLRIPNPNALARRAKLQGEVAALALLEGACDMWDLGCKVAVKVAAHSHRVVKPLVLGLVLSRVISTIQASRHPLVRMGRLPKPERADYYYSQVLGPDWKKQMEKDFVEAVREVQEGLVTEDMLEEKRLLSAAILRRLDRDAYDRMAQYMAFDLVNQNQMYQGAESGESEELARWSEVREKIYDWFYVMTRFGKNAEEWAGKIRTYPQDLDPSALDFDTWAKDVLEKGLGKHLRDPEAIKDPDDVVDALCRSPMFAGVDRDTIMAALAGQDSGSIVRQTVDTVDPPKAAHTMPPPALAAPRPAATPCAPTPAPAAPQPAAAPRAAPAAPAVPVLRTAPARAPAQPAAPAVVRALMEEDDEDEEEDEE